MTDQLFPHQANAVARLYAGTPTYLGFDMGIGKTRTFIEAAKTRGAKRILVLCPASAILVWQRELRLWASGETFVVVRKPEDLKPGRARFYLVSHGLLSQRHGEVANFLPVAAPFDMTAIDEAHAFNSADSLRVKVLRRAALVKKLGMIVPLSGTPMRNHAGDLYTLTSIVAPNVLRTPTGAKLTRTEFEDLFCNVTLKNFGGNRLVRVIEGSRNLAQLRKMISPFMVRVRKEDVLKDLPPIQWETVQVPMDPTHLPVEDQQGLEQTVLSAVGDRGKSLDDALAALVRVGAGHLMEARRKLGLAKLSGALTYLVDMLDSLPAYRKVLVFAVHTDVIKTAAHFLAEYAPAVLTGQSTSAERDEAVTKFLTYPQCRVFIGNIQAAGTALTLVGPNCKCSDVVFIESSWTSADNAQAACRVHRIGQRDGVTARLLSAAGTIDDLIEALLARKAREITELLDGSATVGTPQPSMETT